VGQSHSPDAVGEPMQVVGPVVVGNHLAGRVGRDLTDHRVHQGVEQNPAGREVPVQRHRLHTQGRAQAAHGEPADTFGVDQGDRGV